MYRDWKVYIEDIITAIEKIERYTCAQNQELFLSNEEKQDAVIRNLEVIGEAARVVPDEIKEKTEEIEWHKIIALRNILIHEYFGVSLKIVWDVIQNKLDAVESACQRLLSSL